MKILHATLAISVLALLQACSNQPTQASKPVSVTDDTGVAEYTLINTSGSAAVDKERISLEKNNSITVPEAQIILELYQSGCQFKKVELNRRSQQMHVSCVSDEPLKTAF
jgi:hypothetical protein